MAAAQHRGVQVESRLADDDDPRTAYLAAGAGVKPELPAQGQGIHSAGAPSRMFNHHGGHDEHKKDPHVIETRHETNKAIYETKIEDDTSNEGNHHGKPTMTEKMKAQMRERLGIGKDPMDGVDPHPEVNMEPQKPTASDKVKGAWESMFGNAKAMEREMDKATRKPRAAEEEAHSSVEKLSPFTGPTHGDAAGALEAISPDHTGGVPASEVKAPGLWDRTKEEFEALGEALKEVVTSKKS